MAKKIPRKKSDATRARIKSAIVDLVVGKSAEDITISDICTAGKITHGGFYFYFKNKQKALIEIAEEWLRDFKLEVLEAPHDEDLLVELYGMIRTYVDGYTRNIDLTRVVYSLDPQKTGIRSVYNFYQDRWLARLEERFRGVRASAEREDGQEVLWAHGLTSMLEGICVKTFLLEVPELGRYRQDHATLARELAVAWYRCVTGESPDPDAVVDLA